jgi:hypothetical protein
MEATREHSQLARIDTLLAEAHQRKHELKSLCASMAAQGHDTSVERRVLQTATVSVLLYYEWRRITLEREVRERLAEKKRLAKRMATLEEDGD